ncbi:GAD-like domain-containing protein [Deinococcus arcticus]|uniref:GAD-related domain-containing protein n=1 Tax=Deinococcus arcticus TaxID=2136176 RepID=A0A2T3W3W7_9DEIO|nr:hypothetical protein [Deinococcus arcticus]PTA66601.1 hypothetical protein C8263_17010 [Deinococcus arcticus]
MDADQDAIQYFCEQFGAVVDAVWPEDADIRAYPAFLQTFWRAVGFGARQDGFLWLVDPKDMTWFTPMFGLSEDLIPFARTSFGDVHLFDRNGHCFFFSPNYRELMEIATSFETAVMTLSEPDYIEDDELFARHQAVWAQGQRIDARTCFCLSPAVPFGGHERTSEIYVGALQAYLHLLSQG